VAKLFLHLVRRRSLLLALAAVAAMAGAKSGMHAHPMGFFDGPH